MSSARTFYDNRSRLDDHVLMTGSTWSAGKMNGEDKPTELGAEMWRALEKQESRWSKGLKGFNSTVQLLATTDNPAVSKRTRSKTLSSLHADDCNFQSPLVQALPLALRLQSA
jgi:hypothetical protein